MAAGLGPGDRYAVLAGNCLEYFACYLGAAMANVVTVPLNQRLAPAEWEYIVNDAGSRLVVARNELIAALPHGARPLPDSRDVRGDR